MLMQQESRLCEFCLKLFPCLNLTAFHYVIHASQNFVIKNPDSPSCKKSDSGTLVPRINVENAVAGGWKSVKLRKLLHVYYG
jgi:hypothetical protein